MRSTKTQREAPPASLTVETAAPTRSVVINEDFPRLVTDYATALQSCNDDKASIRTWAAGLSTSASANEAAKTDTPAAPAPAAEPKKAGIFSGWRWPWQRE